MSRIIHTSTPASRRNKARRTIAEILQRLASKSEINDDSKDMLATIVIHLEEIEVITKQSVLAWEKRNYWVKVERFNQKWSWVGQIRKELTGILVDERWDDLPFVFTKIIPQFSDVSVKTLTRKPSQWYGNYGMLMQREQDKFDADD